MDKKIISFASDFGLSDGSVGIVKGVGIAAIFMHLQGDDDSRVLTATALFPVFFIVGMVLFIGLTHPDAADTLPAWCRPGFYT